MSAPSTAGDNLGTLDRAGFPLPRTGETAIEATAGHSAAAIVRALPRGVNEVVYILNDEETKVYSFGESHPAQGAGTEPASAEVSKIAVTPSNPVTRSGTAPAAEAPIQIVGAEPTEGGWSGGLLSEIRIGVMAHDVGAFGRSTEDGFDINGELLFASPDFLEIIFSPRPHIGASLNTQGHTNQVYGGLAWDWSFGDSLFIEGTLALAYHDGEADGRGRGRKSLGCEVLFRESVSLGARFLKRHSISVMLSHISNANLCDDNAGLDNFGLRYGYKF